MISKVINFVAGPGVGKSVCNAAIFVELKKRHHSAEMVLEYAKELIYQNKIHELDDQLNVSTNQYNMIKSKIDKVEYICVCSPLLLGLYYNDSIVFRKNRSDDSINIVKKFILDKMTEFNNIYIFLERNPNFEFQESNRIHTQSESDVINSILKNMLDDLNIEYKTFVVGQPNTISDILDYVDSKKNEFV